MTAPGVASNLLLSGGVGHSFAATSQALAQLLGEVGIASDVTDDIEAGLEQLHSYQLLTVNALRWRMEAERYADLRNQWAFRLSRRGREAIWRHITTGRGILAVHTAAICFDDWTEWGEIVGAAWDWKRSSHPPVGAAKISVHTGAHPVVDGIADFVIVDEVYGFMAVQDDVVPLFESAHGGASHPLLWTREVRGARVAYDALGHDERSYESPIHRRVIRRLGLWMTGASHADVASQR